MLRRGDSVEVFLRRALIRFYGHLVLLNPVAFWECPKPVYCQFSTVMANLRIPRLVLPLRKSLLVHHHHRRLIVVMAAKRPFEDEDPMTAVEKTADS